MTGRLLAISLLLAIAAFASLPAAGAPAAEGEPSPVPADHQLIEEVLRQGRVAGEMPGVGWGGYFVHLGERAAGFLFSLLTGGVTTLLESRELWRWLVWGLLGLGALALLLWLGRLLVDALGRRRQEGEGGPGEVRAEALGPQYALDAAAWRRALAEHLQAGRVAEALEAAWWWVARCLAADRADPAWTSRELVERAGRRELAPEVAALDALTYGPGQPTPAEVSGLVAVLDGRLGP